MDRGQMQTLVGEIPTPMLENYSGNFEAGLVREYMDGGYCVAASMLNSASEESWERRSDRWMDYRDRLRGSKRAGDEALFAIEMGYYKSESEPAFRQQLYEVVVEEIARLRSMNVPPSGVEQREEVAIA